MKHYRLISITVTAVQFNPDNGIFPPGVFFKRGRFYIDTGIVTVHLKSTDWIIKDGDGNTTIASHDQFIKRYEEVSQ